MELHAASFLRCPRAARWLNVPVLPSGVPAELLLASRGVHSTMCPPPPLGRLRSPPCTPATLAFVPAELADHLVLGFALGAVVPSPGDAECAPLLTRFALDPGRKCALSFSYFDDGVVAVSVDCFDEAGDHVVDIKYFAPSPIVGGFPDGVLAGVKILQKRDCPACAEACIPCLCPHAVRLDALMKQRKRRKRVAHAAPERYKDGRATIRKYPYWRQILDQYVDSRIGSYVVQVQHTPHPTADMPDLFGAKHPIRVAAYSVAFRAVYEMVPPHVACRLRRTLNDLGITPLLPPGLAYDGAATVTVDESNKVRTFKGKATVSDWKKVPGLQYDYLLGTPANMSPILHRTESRVQLSRTDDTLLHVSVFANALSAAADNASSASDPRCASSDFVPTGKPCCDTSTCEPEDFLPSPTRAAPLAPKVARKFRFETPLIHSPNSSSELFSPPDIDTPQLARRTSRSVAACKPAACAPAACKPTAASCTPVVIFGKAASGCCAPAGRAPMSCAPVARASGSCAPCAPAARGSCTPGSRRCAPAAGSCVPTRPDCGGDNYLFDGTDASRAIGGASRERVYDSPAADSPAADPRARRAASCAGSWGPPSDLRAAGAKRVARGEPVRTCDARIGGIPSFARAVVTAPCAPSTARNSADAGGATRALSRKRTRSSCSTSASSGLDAAKCCPVVPVSEPKDWNLPSRLALRVKPATVVVGRKRARLTVGDLGSDADMSSESDDYDFSDDDTPPSPCRCVPAEGGMIADSITGFIETDDKSGDVRESNMVAVQQWLQRGVPPPLRV